jgi:hypothetical protein
VYKDITNGIESELDSQIFNITGEDLILTTNDHLKMRYYEIVVTATVTESIIKRSVIFSVNIIDSCDFVIITPVSIDSP